MLSRAAQSEPTNGVNHQRILTMAQPRLLFQPYNHDEELKEQASTAHNER